MGYAGRSAYHWAQCVPQAFQTTDQVHYDGNAGPKFHLKSFLDPATPSIRSSRFSLAAAELLAVAAVDGVVLGSAREDVDVAGFEQCLVHLVVVFDDDSTRQVCEDEVVAWHLRYLDQRTWYYWRLKSG